MLVSSGLAIGTLLLIDASGIAADGGPVSVDVSAQADILMDSAPVMSSDVPTPVALVSMFQTNSTALLWPRIGSRRSYATTAWRSSPA